MDMSEIKTEWLIGGGVLLLLVAVAVAYFVMMKADKSSGGNNRYGTGEMIKEYPLSAFKSGQRTGTMSQPQFLSDILTLKPGEGFAFQTNSVNGSIMKGRADKWELIVYRENNQRQSIHYDSWGDLAYKLNQYMVGSLYFVVKLNGSVFHVGSIKQGPIRKIKNGNEDFETEY